MTQSLTDGMQRLEVKILEREYPRWMNGDGKAWGRYKVRINNREEFAKQEKLSFVPEDIVKTITGDLGRLYGAGEELIVFCTQGSYKGEPQYEVKLHKSKTDSAETVKAFLAGFTSERIATQLIDKFKDEVLQKIIDDKITKEEVKSIKGWGGAEGLNKYESLRESVLANEFMTDIVGAFSQYGFTLNQMKNILAKFGSNSIAKVTENPYSLCEVRGFGFERSDEIAKRMGHDMQSPNRIDAAIRFKIKESNERGNSWIEVGKLIDECASLLGVVSEKVAEPLSSEMDGIYNDGSRVGFARTYEQEKFIGEKLKSMMESSKPLDYNPDEYLAKMEEDTGVHLTDEQKLLHHYFQKYGVVFLVGYAGCGKSYSLQTLLPLFQQMEYKVLPLAPTGKAAKVMESYMKIPAYTIHRALGMKGEASDGVELYHDVIILDESSMADVPIMFKLFSSIKNPNTRIIVVGDDFQIPSVGVGNFLSDCINSQLFPVVKLTKVFRQAEGGILDVATKLRTKTKFVSSDFSGVQAYGVDTILHSIDQEYLPYGYQYYYKSLLSGEWVRLPKENPEDRNLTDILLDLPTQINKYSPDDIVVLTPTKKGALGTVAINKVIQEIVNPPHSSKKEFKYGDVVYRVGDRVINTKNNYRAIDENNEEAVVYNGDMGRIVDINLEEKYLLIDYGFVGFCEGGKRLVVKNYFKSLDTIGHAYALTIHKSQGSGFKAVIVITDKAHSFQSNANLVYTGWTRTMQNLFILCQANIINRSMRINASLERNTFLPSLLAS